jgi:hypothetical protein
MIPVPKITRKALLAAERASLLSDKAHEAAEKAQKLIAEDMAAAYAICHLHKDEDDEDDESVADEVAYNQALHVWHVLYEANESVGEAVEMALAASNAAFNAHQGLAQPDA